ncbi:(2Fe-2S)-binding protein [Aeromicrobium fastidiosum]|uniref:(2Fe-2S)-binding protein n=1 Tax=Aeromicrobium fastidiosum TaxID=52699 RepID=A0A641AV44_9ACTN|nr:(2Fe-2S)-binding protein [Aeromicrobium fastidiosum]KAA1380708.1 (2Fe-2S)-binding protein [Aeromicrobium fastidiosum]MBP2390322.1 sarcosine oxidase subunit alpha [Aeromicrobium fastidiosum]
MPDSRRIASPDARRVQIVVDDVEVTAFEGDTVATALLAGGITAFHRGVDLTPRTPFCNMGTCFECTVTIDDRRLRRACVTPVRPGMRVETGESR